MRRRLILAVSVMAAAFHLYSAGYSPFTALVQRPVHLLFMAVLGFLGVGVARVARAPEERGQWAPIVSGLFLAAAVLAFGYIALEQDTLVRRAGAALPLDLVAGAVAVIVVLELTRRATGPALVVVALLALAYAVTGPWLPGVLAHRGYSPRRIIEHLYLSSEGIWGIPLGVSADFVYLFVVFGAVLEAAGGGALLIALASRAAGNVRGAPAMTAAVASAFMGSLSGSAVANVVTTGAFTIPLMKRAGFRPHFAAAIEAAASTGGQLMPPVMGAGAFILATWTNIPYAKVALAALAPALLFYVALIAAIHFRANRMRLPKGGTFRDEPVLSRLHLLAPLAVIVALLATGRSPMRAAFWGVITAGLAAMLRRSTRPGPGTAADAVVTGAASTVQVAAACATAGIIVGVASLTGIGLRMSDLIVTLSGGHLAIGLLLTGLGSLILGMGLPTTAAYVVLAALGAPALVELGAPLLAAHLFIFYFGCISNVTPPVALAGYAAAGIADAPAVKTGITAMGLAATGFLIPFMFVYGPPLLLAGPPLLVAASIGTAVVGVIGLSAAVIGYARRPLAWWERVVVSVGAFSLIFPGLVTDVVGLVLVGSGFRRGSLPEPAGAPSLEEEAV